MEIPGTVLGPGDTSVNKTSSCGEKVLTMEGSVCQRGGSVLPLKDRTTTGNELLFGR